MYILYLVFCVSVERLIWCDFANSSYYTDTVSWTIRMDYKWTTVPNSFILNTVSREEQERERENTQQS